MLTKTQRQLDTVYQNNINLRDHTVVSVDLPEVARPPKEKTPASSYEAVQRSANLITADAGSAGKQRQEESNALYGLARGTVAMQGESSASQTGPPPNLPTTSQEAQGW